MSARRVMMRREHVAVVVAFGAGGWVCDGDDPCESSLTCPTAVVERCCPQGSPYWCDGQCSATPACDDYLVCKYPDDIEDGLCTAGTFVATIDGITCTPDSQQPAFIDVAITGTMVGCGSTHLVFNFHDPNEPTAPIIVDCGTWIREFVTNTEDSCYPPPALSTPALADWTLHSTLTFPKSQMTLSVGVKLGIAANPILASKMLPCAGP